MKEVIGGTGEKPIATDCRDFRAISLLRHAAKVRPILQVLTTRTEAKTNAAQHVREDTVSLGSSDAIAVLRILSERSMQHYKS